ncbi:MAG: hypothetical protein AB1726_03925 [Planctomycetota bacterium]
MPNGKPGDHPRTDLTVHRLVVYGEPTDGMLKRLIRLLGQDRFDAWFLPHWGKAGADIARAAEAKLALLEAEARSRGGDTDA